MSGDGAEPEVTYLELSDTGDARGESYSVPAEWLADGMSLLDIHVSSILPGHTRGNHLHRIHHEIFVVIAKDKWSLHWDTGEGTPAQCRSFAGPGSVLIRIQPDASHAIRNDGSLPLSLIGLSDLTFNPDQPDSYTRTVTT